MIGTTARPAPAASGLRVVAGRLSSAALIGFLTGVVVGGLGGRLVMLVLRLTSDPFLRGLETDDGFTIGVVSRETMFLVILTAFLGVVGALVYLAIRPWLPPRVRPWTAGVVAGAVGGAVAIRPDGIDFTLLEPLWLAVAMFIALPAAYGVVLAVLVERSFRRPVGERWRSLIGLPLLLPLLPLPIALGLRGPVQTGVLLAAIPVLWLLSRGRGLASAWTTPVVTWIGRTALAAVTALAVVVLVRDVVAVL